jgi:hypothetical protein
MERIMARAVIYSLFALITSGIGGFIMLESFGAFGPVAATADSPAWLGAVMGFVFFAGGACVLLKALYGAVDSNQSELPPEAPAPVRFFYNALGVSIVVGLGALFTWVAFGPGERSFSGSGAFLGPIIGRAMFGLGALLAWLLLAWTAVRWARRRGESSP